jgi:hypothetical protein
LTLRSAGAVRLSGELRQIRHLPLAAALVPVGKSGELPSRSTAEPVTHAAIWARERTMAGLAMADRS